MLRKICLLAVLLTCASEAGRSQSIPITEDLITGTYREVGVTMRPTKALESVNRSDYMYIHEPFLRTIVRNAWISNYRLVFNEQGKVAAIHNESVVLENSYRDTLLIESIGYDVYDRERHYIGSTVYEYDSLGRLLREKQYMPPNRGADTSWPKRWFVSKTEYAYQNGQVRKTKTRYFPPDSIHAQHTETSIDNRDQRKKAGEVVKYANGRAVDEKIIYDKAGDFTRHNYSPGGALLYSTRLEYTSNGKFKSRVSYNPDSTIAYQNKYHYDGRGRLIRIESKFKAASFREITSYNPAGLAGKIEVFRNGKLLYRRLNHYNKRNALIRAEYVAANGGLLLDYVVTYID